MLLLRAVLNKHMINYSPGGSMVLVIGPYTKAANAAAII